MNQRTVAATERASHIICSDPLNVGGGSARRQPADVSIPSGKEMSKLEPSPRGSRMGALRKLPG